MIQQPFLPCRGLKPSAAAQTPPEGGSKLLFAAINLFLVQQLFFKRPFQGAAESSPGFQPWAACGNLEMACCPWGRWFQPWTTCGNLEMACCSWGRWFQPWAEYRAALA